MRTIESFAVDCWSEPDENGRVRHTGMANAREIFNKLEAHLRKHGLLPDDYFLFNEALTGELPDYDEMLCIPRYGISEGVYVDISLVWRDQAGAQKQMQFATGKTLGESADDFMRMSRIAAECSLLLNGHGQSYARNETELPLTEDELRTLTTVLDIELENESDPEWIRRMTSVLDKGKQALRQLELHAWVTPAMKMGGM